MNSNSKILLGHGSGGKLSHELISDIFLKYFNNEILGAQTDSAVLDIPGRHLSFTTDSYVVDPIFFQGGNIGKLAVCGTINDIAVSGAKPLYLSCGFIIEEGFALTDLETIAKTMAEEAKNAGVKIVTGDTKIVNKGKCDKIFINTAGIGVLAPEKKDISFGANIKPGDKIIVNGSIGDHGIAILAARESLSFQTDVQSDCASLNDLIQSCLASSENIKFMRDATRGGIATVLCELAENKNLGVIIEENEVPLKDLVKGTCEVFGFDPLYLANEGKVVMVAGAQDAGLILQKMRSHPLGQDARIIGEITKGHPTKVLMHTEIGGRRIIDMLAGEMLPRIC
ncbi:MAG: hydrogenase expression/formation protein HypE [Bacteroidetes bacterium 4572_114]|nr:MAG: hydrogenase expression/formation protein HypE [Bacteroidetes bacterium 4572_114]